ncbi:bile acid:Na+ symporter, BASS family [Filimonas lacunae]|uniref:Bile acid:Na+ symporter, BASS family n=1 Tax=Filimonas lacunae TaxID=477680 RepID=A0A173MH16_9BACT|nr:bile acid:sodium symporter family protein [Filimonas lacunae]BAV06780.1 sodium-dependent transporter [Filimonas lacunae]SIT34373.1 bile acid:Na+ symporter, BASS family [Filimonas lacunae]
MSLNHKPLYTGGLVAAIACACLYLFLTLRQLHVMAGWCLVLALLCTALAVRGHPLLRGFSYTITILAAVCMALYYPRYFVHVGSFRLSSLTIPLLQLIMFGMGTELSLNDFSEVLQSPKKVVVGMVGHFTIMPFLGFGIAHLFHFPGEVAAGIILIGCSPSGLASNVMAYLAKANLALSVCITALSTLLAPVLTPLLMKLLGGTYIEVHFWAMLWDIAKIVLLPIAAGLLFNYFLYGRFPWLDKAMPFVSMAGIMFIIIIFIAAGRDHLLQVGALLLLAVLMHNAGGFFIGYWLSRLLGFAEKDCRTISIEIGMQNGGLASGLALNMGKMATVGLAPAIFSSMMNVTGSALASWWHHHLPEEHDHSPSNNNNHEQEPSAANPGGYNG